MVLCVCVCVCVSVCVCACVCVSVCVCPHLHKRILPKAKILPKNYLYIIKHCRLNDTSPIFPSSLDLHFQGQTFCTLFHLLSSRK